MKISLNELLRTGNLDDLRLGMTKEAIQTLLGHPDATGSISRRYPQPSIWLYGTAELWFRQQAPYDLIGFWWEPGQKGAFHLTTACEIVDWAFTPEATFEQIEDYLRDHGLSFEYRDFSTTDEAMPDLVLPSGVRLSFQDGILYGLYQHAPEK